ncbi:MAG: glycosyltransferase family 2 protein [Hyphomicrobiaceae bacterium]|nr:glycosyltransferase family 2 protein [Hyphomicrobiaceae bacterium]
MTGLVAICVCTMDRPQQLRQLLRALGRLDAPGPGHREIVIVVDNSSDATARAVVDEAAASAPERYRYAHEPRRGLAFARNRALGEAMLARADLIAFIDDDEMPRPGWLGGLIEALETRDAAAAIGPVEPVFEASPPRWLPLAAYALERSPAADGCVREGYTSNAILRAAAVREHQLRFDEHLNASGGEDTEFFMQLLRAGGRIAWAPAALVHEYVPRSRMTVAWLWRRWYRIAVVEAWLRTRGQNGATGTLFSLARGLARVVAGTGRVGVALVTWTPRRPDMVIASFFTLCRGLGYIASALGTRADHYASKRYR